MPAIVDYAKVAGDEVILMNGGSDLACFEQVKRVRSGYPGIAVGVAGPLGTPEALLPVSKCWEELEATTLGRSIGIRRFEGTSVAFSPDAPTPSVIDSFGMDAYHQGLTDLHRGLAKDSPLGYGFWLEPSVLRKFQTSVGSIFIPRNSGVPFAAWWMSGLIARLHGYSRSSKYYAPWSPATEDGWSPEFSILANAIGGKHTGFGAVDERFGDDHLIAPNGLRNTKAYVGFYVGLRTPKELWPMDMLKHTSVNVNWAGGRLSRQFWEGFVGSCSTQSDEVYLGSTYTALWELIERPVQALVTRLGYDPANYVE